MSLKSNGIQVSLGVRNKATHHKKAHVTEKNTFDKEHKNALLFAANTQICRANVWHSTAALASKEH